MHFAPVGRALRAAASVALKALSPPPLLPTLGRLTPAMPASVCLALVVGAVAPATSALAQQSGGDRTVGPGRIVCNASFCELGSGALPKQRFRINVSALPEAEVRRLRTCTGVSKPCIVTVEGTQLGDPMKIMADSIQWQE